MAYTDDILGLWQKIADTAGEQQPGYPSDLYGQMQRVADAIGEPATHYPDSEFGLICRIADAVGVSGATYTPDVFGQLQRIADAVDSGGISRSIFEAVQRIANNADNLTGGDFFPSLDFSDARNSQYALMGIFW